MYNIQPRNVVNNTVISHTGTDGHQTPHSDHFIVCVNISSLCRLSETNIIVYINYISILKIANHLRK